jgi:hypothetical protein
MEDDMSQASTGDEPFRPSDYAAMDGYYDCTHLIGQSGTYRKPTQWPMYSYERPGSTLWNTIAGELWKRGFTDEQIKTWLQSKHPRWALDGKLGDAIEALAKQFAATITGDEIERLANDA